jgi:hypothetical protein
MFNLNAFIIDRSVSIDFVCLSFSSSSLLTISECQNFFKFTIRRFVRSFMNFFINERISFYVHDWKRYKEKNIDTFRNEWWVDLFVLYVSACSFALVVVILSMKMIAYYLILYFQQSILDAWCVKTRGFNLDIYWYNKLLYILSSIARYYWLFRFNVLFFNLFI